MDIPETRILHPRDVLRQVAESMDGQCNELSVTLPVCTSWRAAIQAAEAALGDVDEPFILMPPGTGNRRLLQEKALQSASESPSENVLGRPIRTSVNIKTAKSCLALSRAAREHLHKMAEEAANAEF
ncbi:uncharacterized protein P174DRAFT_507368 [Aspergillus novofumigatus IBT 16806]|uniref:Uncharacterized protein n=1 Tax=Aspergillus novofumigatus (strain IBT 16806) TaxID=1392255 RepID=A0A2I1BWE9_ASPN1|nr:uncharacterized protein P174DRAFT_507368 [Aspergillus novofumigatus IBT 16806]PKX89708.1 hypothetical protein P174DRAFT_507368 [Aspergillus novofumigatus IBT 16806]